MASKKPRRRRHKPTQLELKVCFDTNALYTGSASHFLRKELGELIEQQEDLPDLCVRWLVPDNNNLNTCMDYTSNPDSNQHPNIHDYQQLNDIYGCLRRSLLIVSVGETTGSARQGRDLSRT